MPKRIDFNDTVEAGMAKTAEEAGHFNTNAREKNADGNNTQARFKTTSSYDKGSGHLPVHSLKGGKGH